MCKLNLYQEKKSLHSCLPYKINHTKTHVLLIILINILGGGGGGVREEKEGIFFRLKLRRMARAVQFSQIGPPLLSLSSLIRATNLN